MVGRALPHFKFREELSRDGMGIAYLALELKLDDLAALKVLSPEFVFRLESKRRFFHKISKPIPTLVIHGVF